MTPNVSRPILFALAGALFAIGFAAAPAGAAIAPETAHSPNAEDMRTAYWVMLIVATVVGLALGLGLLVAFRRFRSDDDSARPRQLTAGGGVIARIAGGLTLAAAAIFIFGAVVSSGVKNATADEEIDEIEIHAAAQQWLWRFGYPEQAEGTFSEGINTIFSYNELVVPVDTLVNLKIDSTDVIHSWNVPALGPQIWAVPGEIQETSFIADEEGVYEGRSTVFSGTGYPVMRATVRVVSAEEYQDYIEQLNTDLQEGQQAVVEADQTEAEESSEGTGAEVGEEVEG